MGRGYIIGCSKCITEEDIKKCYHNEKINGTYFDITTGGNMLCFCREQIEKIYGINKTYNRDYRILAGGDPPDEIYKIIKSPVKDKNINDIIHENINNGYDFTENLGYLPYYCENCNNTKFKIIGGYYSD